MGLIDTLTAGFRTVRQHVWLLLLPLLLDLWFWLGPQLSIRPLIAGILKLWPSAGLPPELEQMSTLYQQTLSEAGTRFNLLWLLNNELTWLNQLLPGLNQPARFTASASPIEVAPLALLLWAPLLLATGLGLGSAFLTSVMSQLPSPEGANAQDSPKGLRFWVRRGLRTWGLTVVYGVLLLGLLVIVVMMLSLALTAVLLIIPSLGTPLSTLSFLLLGWVVVWTYFMLYFVVAALVSDGVGLGQAIWRSANVVTRNFWPTVGLALLSAVILGGFGFIWQRLAVLSPVGTLVGILGNALLLTGLVAARLIFYRDRYARWQQALANPGPAPRRSIRP